MKITSVLGHLMELEFREPFNKWSGCRPDELFTAPVDKTVKKDMENVAHTLKEEARNCDVLMLWLDCDLEGENIAFEVCIRNKYRYFLIFFYFVTVQVMNVCMAVNRRLTVFRARFSALIPRDIMGTLRSPARPNQNMAEAG